MDASRWIANRVTLNSSGVYEVVGLPPIPYSDGRANEKYLENAFTSSDDLSSVSAELEGYIKDWPSEYHLSRRRAQLLAGLEFDTSSSVLEVGCGCGAITRFLGERFESVVSVEGSPERAALARQRCADLENVLVICAPYEELTFTDNFDLLVCVGVYEYASIFVKGPSPHARVLDYFSRQLSDDGVLLLAIENQYGLKYFAGASEDHTQKPYDGIESYAKSPNQPRTFGHARLKRDLKKNFKDVSFFFPFPDYKIPDLLLSESAFEHLDVTALLGTFESTDYSTKFRPEFAEREAWRDIVDNDYVSIFANSFLITAGKKLNQRRAVFSDLAVSFNRNRAEPFHTKSRLFLKGDEAWIAKSKLNACTSESVNDLQLRSYTELWQHGETVHTLVRRNALSRSAAFDEVFAPVSGWYDLVVTSEKDGFLPGHMLDAIWQNTVSTEDGAVLIDQEWQHVDRISIQYLFIRSVFWFLVDIRSGTDIANELRWKSVRSVCHKLAKMYGMNIDSGDFSSFLQKESSLNGAVFGRPTKRVLLRFQLYLHTPHAIRVNLLAAEERIKVVVAFASKIGKVALRVIRKNQPGI
ncbi:MAG: class I SAM-dependent methyltransferase [Pseudomonadota bacterium]